jgi:hypothetical protein
MAKVFAGVAGVLTTLVLNGSLALANAPQGGAPDYSGVSYMYYTLIGVVLAYGVYDTFFKKS